MEKQRLFIALELPEDLRLAVHQRIQSLRQAVTPGWMHWVGSDMLHLTLKFLGDTPVDRIPLVRQRLEAVAGGMPPFSSALAGLGVFPLAGSPRVVWMAMEPAATLTATAHALDAALEQDGFGRDKRGFIPHVTIAWVNRRIGAAKGRQLAEAVKGFELGTFPEFCVDHLALVHSQLRPEGALHTVIAETPLLPGGGDGSKHATMTLEKENRR